MKRYLVTDYQKKIFEDRYAQIKKNGEKETTVEEMFDRIVSRVATNETEASAFSDMLLKKEFIPGGRILANVGGTGTNMAGNCFVLPISDSRSGIMKCQSDTFEVNATGGGTGTNFTKLRPRGALVKGVRGKSSGPCSFMDGFDGYALTIKQGGSRRAARMTMLNVDHPDILEFIRAKQDLTRWTTTNISVGISNAFMDALANDDMWTLQFDGTVYEEIKATDLWDEICECARETGEPGVIFLDTLRDKYPLSYLYDIECVNVCGEVPLPPYGMCLLGSIVVSQFVDSNMRFDFDHFERVVTDAVTFLDNVIDISTFPIPEIENRVRSTRPIGLGLTSLADSLFLLGIPYGNNVECLSFLDSLGKSLYNTARKASEHIAVTKGSFPDYDSDLANYPPRSNSTLVAYAPAGTISGLAGCSYGIEPHFAPVVTRNEEIGRDVVSNAIIDNWMKGHDVAELPDWARFAGGASEQHEINIDDHLEVLATLSSYVDSAISKTVNAPSDATVEDVSNIYKFMYERGVKGGTIYRDGSRENQPVSAGDVISTNGEWSACDDEIEFVDLVSHPRSVPDVSDAIRYRLKYNPSKPSLYVHLVDDNDGPLEIFFSTLDAQNMETLTGLALTMTSLFRRGIDCLHLLEKWKKYESTNSGGWYDKQYVPSMLSGIAMVIERHFRTMGYINTTQTDSALDVVKQSGRINGERCPECGEYTLVNVTGCPTCRRCGYSECG